MKANRVHRFGPPEVISFEDVPCPVPGKNEVLTRVRATGVGPWDSWIRSGKSVLPQPLPLTLGSDLAGTVEEIAEGVTEFRPGDDYLPGRDRDNRKRRRFDEAERLLTYRML